MTHREMIEGYKVLEEIASTNYGEVYKVQPLGIERAYTLKLSEGHPERLDTERDALQRLSGHPNITDIYFAGEHNGEPFIVREYLDMDLKSWLSQRPDLLWGEAIHIIKGVLKGLEYAHKKGIVHSDLKPSNILLSSDPKPRVALSDFGLAQIPRADTLETSLEDITVAGTIEYMAPEQKQGEKIDGRADIYSTGVILYEMLMRETPDRNPRRPSSTHMFPPWLDEVTFKAFSQDPADRYQSASEMIEAIDAGLNAHKKSDKTPATRPKRFTTGVKSALTHLLKTPLYILGAPYYAAKAVHGRNPRNKALAAQLSLATLALGSLAYYPFVLPSAAESYLEHRLENANLKGTISFIRDEEIALYDARKLPEQEEIIIPAVRPRAYTLAPDGKTLYYISDGQWDPSLGSPFHVIDDSIIHVDLKSGRQTRLVQDKSVDDITELTVQDGTLYARGGDYIWRIEGNTIEPTQDLPLFPRARAEQGEFELDEAFYLFRKGVEVQGTGPLPGNIDLGRSFRRLQELRWNQTNLSLD